MKKDSQVFVTIAIQSFFETIQNLFFFFPYFFSVKTLLTTLFYPWKNIITKKTTRGFSFSEICNRMLLNGISSGIGVTMRLSVILFFLLFQVFFILSVPLLVILFFVCILPLKVLFFYIRPSEQQRYEMQKQHFLTTHCLNSENREKVVQWFDIVWKETQVKKLWWKKTNLFSYPPLARDWAFGFTPTLDTYCEDLTGVVYQRNKRHIVGRKQELQQMEEVLCKSNESNLILVGEEGVGKHTVVDAFARLVYEGQTSNALTYRRILKLNMEKILTVSTDQKQREQFFEELCAEAIEAKSIILVIDNIDKYVATGPDRVDLSGSIEKYARRPEIQFIGITSPFFYQRFVFSNEKMNRLFVKIDVPEINRDQALETVLDIIPEFEQNYSVVIPYETAQTVIEKSEFYITSIPFPEKAIDLLDSVCSFIVTQNKKKKNIQVIPDYVDTVLTQKTHIPTRLTDEMKSKLLHLEQELNNRVLFQDNAVHQLSAAIRRSFVLLGKRKKPLATFLFLGPTGVGKTETAKALSLLFFGSEKHLARFDMSLYQSKDDIKTLIGSIDSGLPGLLTKTIREQPFSVLLLDELEKAHPDLLNIFLTVIDEGYFTDGFGKRVDCKNLIVIATSNAGSDFIYKQQEIIEKLDSVAMGGSDGGIPTRAQSDENWRILNYLIQNHIFSPEFLNRFDGVVLYNPITENTILVLAKNMITRLRETLYSLYKIHIEVSDETLSAIIKKGYNPQFGARNLEHILSKELEDAIAQKILEGSVKEGETIQL